MILTITHNLRQIVFFKGTRFRFTSASPIFSEDGFVSFPFNIPVAENRLALDFCEKLDISPNLPGRNITPPGFPAPELVEGVAWSRSPVKIPVIVDSKLFDFKSGYLFITPGNDEYSCTLVVGQGKFNNEVTGKSIIELCDMPVEMGEDIDEFITAANTQITKSFPEVDFNFPIMKNDEAYSNETLNESFRFINYFKWWVESPSFVKNDVFKTLSSPFPGFPDTTYPSINNYNSFVACPFVFAVLKNIIEIIGYAVSGNPLSDARINQLMFIHNKPLDQDSAVNMDHMVRARLNYDFQIPYYADFSVPINLNFNQTSPLPYQNPGSIYNTGTNLFSYPKTIDSVYQFHYVLIIQNPVAVARAFYVGVTKYYDGDHTPWIHNSELISLPASGSITIDSYINLPCTPGMHDIYLSLHFQAPLPTDDTDSPIIKTGSTLDIIPISDALLALPLNSFNLKNYLPDVSLKSILDDLKYLFGIIPFINKFNTISLEFFKDIFSSTPILDLSDYLLRDYEKDNSEKIKSIAFPSGFEDSDLTYTEGFDFDYSTLKAALHLYYPDGHYFINDHDEYYSFSWVRHLQDLSKIVFEVEDGDEISINASLPEIIIGAAPGSSNNKGPMPYFTSPLISPLNDEVSNPEYKLGFWRGKIADYLGNTYPLATPWVYDINSLIYQVDLQLKLNGTYGLHDNYLTELISVLNAENNIFKVEMELTQDILNQLQYNKRYTVAGVPILIKSIDFEFDEDDEIIQPVSLELIKC